MTSDRDRRDPLAALAENGGRDKEALVKAAGGLLSANEVARLLGITRQAVHERVREKRLLAVSQGGEDRYPAIQFAEREVVPGLPEVPQSIGLEGSWGILDFVLAPEDDLEGLAPIEALRTRPDLRETVIEHARAEGRQGA